MKSVCSLWQNTTQVGFLVVVRLCSSPTNINTHSLRAGMHVPVSYSAHLCCLCILSQSILRKINIRWIDSLLVVCEEEYSLVHEGRFFPAIFPTFWMSSLSLLNFPLLMLVVKVTGISCTHFQQYCMVLITHKVISIFCCLTICLSSTLLACIWSHAVVALNHKSTNY